MSNDSKIGQAWIKWQTYVLYWNLVKTFRIGPSSSLREIIFAIELPLRGTQKILYDGAHMTSTMVEPLSNAMK
jgi:hypothetical protein